MPLSLIASCFALALLFAAAVIACGCGVLLIREARHGAGTAVLERTGVLAILLGLLLLALALGAMVAGESYLAAR